MSHRTTVFDDPSRVRGIHLLAVVVALEAIVLVAYYGLTDVTVTDVRYALYPFVWIDVGLLAVLLVSPTAADRRTRVLGIAVAAAYFLALAWIAGLVGLELGSHAHSHVRGLQVTMSSPGYGPRIGYAGSIVSLSFVPYRVIGYLALAYLVYAAVLDATGAAFSGLLAVGSCIGCSLPLVAPAVAGLAGGGLAGLFAAARPLSIDISTAVFVASVALLAVRPGD